MCHAVVGEIVLKILVKFTSSLTIFGKLYLKLLSLTERSRPY